VKVRKYTRRSKKAGEMTPVTEESNTVDLEMGTTPSSVVTEENTVEPEIKDLEMGPEPVEEDSVDYDKLEKGEIPSYHPDGEEMVGGKKRIHRRKTMRKSKKTLKRKSRRLVKRSKKYIRHRK
jgi:hypothetical protein